MANNRVNRSQKYQHLFNEKSFSNDMLDNFHSGDSIYKRLNPFDYNEEVLELEDQLRNRFMELIKEHLTERQLEIVYLLMSGKTQSESSALLKINQSSITKSINGNVDYSDKDNKKRYGGISLKMRKIADKDEKIKEILERITELRGDNWL